MPLTILRMGLPLTLTSPRSRPDRQIDSSPQGAPKARTAPNSEGTVLTRHARKSATFGDRGPLRLWFIHVTESLLILRRKPRACSRPGHPEPCSDDEFPGEPKPSHLSLPAGLVYCPGK